MRKHKNKWSKRVSLLLCSVFMVSSIAACGNNNTETPSTTTKSNNNVVNQGEDTSVQESVEDTTAEDTSLFPAFDLGGVTITLLNHSNIAGLDPNAEGIEQYEKEDREANVKRIEEKYNVKLEFVAPPTDVWDDLTKEVISAYAAGQPVADVMDCYYQFLGTYVANDILYDMTEVLDNTDIFNPENYCTWMNKKWGVSFGMGGEGIFYNKDMIKRLGMDKTPAEMFSEGKWSYDDFYNYCMDMKSKMADNEYPLFVSPYYWMLFATAGNDIQILGGDGNLNYLDPGMLETMEFLQKLIDAGLCRKPNMTEDGGYDSWGTGGATFDNGVEVAMCHRAIWQVDGLVGKFDIGYVPYPWGSNVTAGKTGEAGDYKTLSNNYKTSYFDGQVLTLTKGVEQKADPLAVMVMVTDFMRDWNFTAANYQKPEESVDNTRWFNDPLDAELYNYSQDIKRWEPYNSLDIELSLSLNKIFYGGESLRSNFESFYNADMAAMIEAGYATPDVMNTNKN